jgi:hypothetical protein
MTFGRFTARASGALVMLLGAWAGIAPFVGPLFGYRMDSAAAWSWTTSRAELSVGPGVIAILGGLLLLTAGPRMFQRVGGLLAGVAGAWLVVGTSLMPIWTGSAIAFPNGTAGGLAPSVLGAVEGIGFFYGVGVLIAGLAAYAIGALSGRGFRWVTAPPPAQAATELQGKSMAPAAPPPAPPVAAR